MRFQYGVVVGISHLMTLGFVVAKHQLLLDTSAGHQFPCGGLDIYQSIGALPFIPSDPDIFIVANHVGTMKSALAETHPSIPIVDVLGSQTKYGDMDHIQKHTHQLWTMEMN
jgi:hypothetical protein